MQMELMTIQFSEVRRPTRRGKDVTIFTWGIKAGWTHAKGVHNDGGPKPFSMEYKGPTLTGFYSFKP